MKGQVSHLAKYSVAVSSSYIARMTLKDPRLITLASLKRASPLACLSRKNYQPFSTGGNSVSRPALASSML